MKRKVLSFLLILTLTVSAMPLAGIDFSGIFTFNAFALDEEEDTAEPESYYFNYGDYYCYKTKKDTVNITKYTGSDTVIEIPAEINGYPVTMLGQYSFSPRSAPVVVNAKANEALYNLKKVIVPSSVEFINAFAFFYCTSLETVVLPEGPETLADCAFSFCTSLAEIEFPSTLESVGNNCFNNTAIEEVVFKKNPENSFYVSSNALSHSNIKKCVFLSDNTTLSYDVFANSAVEEVIFEGSVSVNTSEHAFRNSDSVQKIVFRSDISCENFAEILVNEYGYYLHIDTAENYIYFDRSPEGEASLISGDFVYGLNAKNEAVILGYNGASSDVVIPETLDGHTVTEIGPYAFNNWINEYEENAQNTFLTSVTIPETVTVIGTYAFNNNRKLSSVNLHGKLEIIDDYAFHYAGITEAVIPESVKSIGTGAFYECQELERAVVPEGITVLKDGAFAMCPKLVSVSLPEGLEKIELSCFIDTPLLADINIPSTVKEIGEYAFENCGIESIILPEGLEVLGESAFHLTKAKSAVVDGKNLAIPEHAFSGCSQLETLELKNGIKEIGDYAFIECTALKSVTIPKSVEKIGYSPFTRCTALTVIYYNAINCDIKKGSNSSPALPTRPVFYECYNVEEVYIGDKVEYIGKKLFAERNNLKTVYMSDSVKVIDAYAFSDCVALESITLPANAEEINSFAFKGCTSLETVTIPANVKELSLYAFDGCPLRTINYYPTECEVLFYQQKSEDGILYSPFYQFRSTLAEFNLGEGFTEIPDNYFSGLKKLSKVTMPDTVKQIGDYAFYGCESLESIEIPKNAEAIGSYAFYGCKLLKDIYIPSSIRDLSEYAFAYTATESFKAGYALESVGDGCFMGCAQLTEIDLGSVMLIGEDAFADCTALTEAVIPDSVSNIGKRAFKNCTTLTKVIMSADVKYIPDECFYGCSALSEFTWEADSKLIGIMSFAYCTSLNEFNFENLKKLYDNSFLSSGVTVVQLGEAKNETASELKEIETQSFMNCESLETLGIGGNVSTVKSQAFADCTSLETAVISDSVTEIADDAFDGCDNLTIYCSEDSYAYSYAQTQGIKVSTFVIAAIPNQTYTGFEITPDVSVSLSGDTLDKNVDFGVTYANNIDVGNADVTVKGKGDFRMFASRANFAIVTKNISAAVIADIPAQDYTGSAITPSITVTDGANILREGVDYTVTYSDNIKEGTAKVQIKGIGNYSGTASASFEIEQMSIVQRIISAVTSFFNSITARIIAFFMGLFM